MREALQSLALYEMQKSLDLTYGRRKSVTAFTYAPKDHPSLLTHLKGNTKMPSNIQSLN